MSSSCSTRIARIGQASAATPAGDMQHRPVGDLVGVLVGERKPGNEGFGVALLVVTTFLQIDPAAKSGLPRLAALSSRMHFTALGRRLCRAAGGAHRVDFGHLDQVCSGHWPERRQADVPTASGGWGTAVLGTAETEETGTR